MQTTISTIKNALKGGETMPKKTKQEETKTPEKIQGVVENSNINILNNIDNYLQYLRDNIKQIIIDDELKYSDPMEKKKTYPDFTYIQFCYLLSRLYDRVFSVNTELLYINYNNHFSKVYDIPKVELCYKVYSKLCGYYGFICSIEQFETMTGIDDETLKEWLSCGKSKLYNFMIKNAKNNVVSSFENSKLPLLRLAGANYKYQLDKPVLDRQEEITAESLPDLLQLPGTDKKPGLQG